MASWHPINKSGRYLITAALFHLISYY